MRRLLSISIGILISTLLSFSQSDTILVSSGVKDSIDIKYDRIYKLFIQDKSHDVRHLWKVNLLQLSYLPLNLAYEQKIGNKWSNETYLGISPNFYFIPDYTSYEYYILLEDRIKYYYNLTRRERLGKNTGGFSGNYLGIGGALKGREWSSFNAEYHYPSIDYISFLYYGLQRRIGNIGYFEMYIGVGHQINIKNSPHEGLYWDMTLRLGFAIESMAELKRMLR
jgi:hypothetical protein